MTSKEGYAPPKEQQQQMYQQPEGTAYKIQEQDYEILEAGLVPNINAGGGGGSAAELEKQLRLGERERREEKRGEQIDHSGEFSFQKTPQHLLHVALRLHIVHAGGCGCMYLVLVSFSSTFEIKTQQRKRRPGPTTGETELRCKNQNLTHIIERSWERYTVHL